jgi:cobalt/nickel transport system permease protein
VKTPVAFSPRRWPAALKVAGAFAFILAVTQTPAARWGWFAAEGAAVLGVLLSARASPRLLLRRLLVLSPIVAGAVWAAAGRGGGVLALRSGLGLAAVIALGQTTSFAEILGALRAARVPALLLTTLALMHRYIFVLGDESARMGRARAARTLAPRRRLAWLAAASVVGQLFVRASERAERVYDAMCARGWNA